MTDGQSEANREQLCYKHGDRILANPELIHMLVEKVRYSCPGWTLEDQRLAVFLLTGEYLEQRKRCEVCNATGVWKYYRQYPPLEMECAECDGTGYVG